MEHYTAQSFWVSKKRGKIKTENLKKIINKDELLIETRYTGISYGTEKIVFDSNVPSNQYNLMKAPHQEGSFNTSVKYGYLNVGEVKVGPRELMNKMVYSMYPHQTKFIIKSSLVTQIPAAVPLKRALLTANMETAINAMWDSNPMIGDKTYVVGAGVVGILMAYVLSKTFGLNVIIIDKDIKKKNICKSMGLKYENDIKKINDPDIIYECTGNISVLNKLVNQIKLDTKICILSWYGKQVSNIRLGENCFSRRASIIFSQVGNIPSNRLRKFDNLKRRELALNMLNDDTLDILLDKKEIQLKDLPIFFKKQYSKGLCKVVKYYV